MIQQPVAGEHQGSGSEVEGLSQQMRLALKQAHSLSLQLESQRSDCKSAEPSPKDVPSCSELLLNKHVYITLPQSWYCIILHQACHKK